VEDKPELLRNVPLLSDLAPGEIERLSALAREVSVPGGHTLTRQGEPGDEFFLVLGGTIVVERDGQGIARLGPGDFLGEISLIDGRPRTATATAEGPARLLVLGHSDFDRLLDESPTLARRIMGTLVERVRRTVTVPQFGIFAQGTSAHVFLEWDLRPEMNLREAATVLGRLRGPSVSAGGVNLVVAFGSELWRALAPTDLPDGLGPFQRGGPAGPARQHDLWVWINGSSQDVVFEHARAAAGAIRTVANLANEQAGFVHRNSRDLTGFIDGTANPTLLEAPAAALVPDGRPGAGGSHVLAMRWVHDLEAFDALPVPEQERVIGRTKDASIELDEEHKPANAHIARVEIEDAAGNELPIYRRSVPYGTVAEHGLYFVAFSAERSRYDRMLDRMFGLHEDGLHDRLIEFSRPVSAAYYYAPPLNLLSDLPVAGGG
jgi:porphyrinogen peroxidase